MMWHFKESGDEMILKVKEERMRTPLESQVPGTCTLHTYLNWLLRKVVASLKRVEGEHKIAHKATLYPTSKRYVVHSSNQNLQQSLWRLAFWTLVSQRTLASWSYSVLSLFRLQDVHSSNCNGKIGQSLKRMAIRILVPWRTPKQQQTQSCLQCSDVHSETNRITHSQIFCHCSLSTAQPLFVVW